MTKITNDIEFRSALEQLLKYDDELDSDLPEYQALLLSIEDYEKDLHIPNELLTED